MAERLRSVESLHSEDIDGGYSLLWDIVELGRHVDENQSADLREELLRLVGTKDKSLWGVALEALVQLADPVATKSLAIQLDINSHGAEWEYYVLFALVRLKHEPITRRAVDHILRSLANHDLTIMPMLAALSKLDADKSLHILTDIIVKLHQSNQFGRLAGYAPAIVSHLSDVNAELLQTLIENVKLADVNSASDLSLLLASHR